MPVRSRAVLSASQPAHKLDGEAERLTEAERERERERETDCMREPERGREGRDAERQKRRT
eukprot:COSAG06_NODE_11041_length_1577_cov_2.134641_1_plen_60_part_10